MGKRDLDILGVKPIAEAINTSVSKTFEGAEGFLKRVCAPALEELGLGVKEKVRNWRLNNIVKFLEKSQGKLIYDDDKLKINPRIAISIIENASLNDNDEIQEMWAGLFAASCSSSEQSDENLIFINLLKQLTIAQARILKYACENTKKYCF